MASEAAVERKEVRRAGLLLSELQVPGWQCGSMCGRSRSSPELLATDVVGLRNAVIQPVMTQRNRSKRAVEGRKVDCLVCTCSK